MLPALLADRTFGAPDPGPDAVTWLLARDQLGLGLMLSTDARGGLSTAVATPDDACPAVRYAAAFMRFLQAALSRKSHITRHIRVEGWSCIGRGVVARWPACLPASART